MVNKLIQIYSSYFTAGIVCENGVVVRAAPIIKYMRGWNGEQFVKYCKKKGFTYAIIDQWK